MKNFAISVVLLSVVTFSGCGSNDHQVKKNIIKVNKVDKDLYKTLSDNSVEAMVKSHDFFDKYFNPSGNFKNDFIAKTINGDTVVIDKVTGLMWHSSGSAFQMQFCDSKEWINHLNAGGYAGFHSWRLPTLEEAASLIANKRINGDLYISRYFSKVQIYIWTGDKFDLKNGWIVNFYLGHIYKNLFLFKRFIRPVRRL